MAREEIPTTETLRRAGQISRRAKLLRLAAQGLNAKQAAAIANLSYATVLAEYGDVEFKAQVFRLVEGAFAGVDGKVADFNLTLHDRIRLKSEEAFSTLCEIMDDERNEPAIRARVAQDILDRNPESQAGSTIRHERLDAQQLALAAASAREMDNVLPFKPKGVVPSDGPVCGNTESVNTGTNGN